MPFSIREDYSTQSRGGAECSCCGAGQRPVDATDPNGPRERVLDTDIFIDTEGVFEICETCCVEIGSMFGMIEEPTATGLKLENDSLRRRAEKAEADLTAAKQGFLTTTQYLIADQDNVTAKTAAAAPRA